MERFAISYLRIEGTEAPVLVSARRRSFQGGACSNELMLSFALTDLNRKIRFYNNEDGKGEFRGRALRAADAKEKVLGWALGQAPIDPFTSSKAAEVLEAMMKYGSLKYEKTARELFRQHGDSVKEALNNDPFYGTYLDKDFIEGVLG